MAYSRQLSLVAVGTENGKIVVYLDSDFSVGKPGFSKNGGFQESFRKIIFTHFLCSKVGSF